MPSSVAWYVLILQSCWDREMTGWGGHLSLLEWYLTLSPLCVSFKRSTSPPSHVHHLLEFPIQISKLRCSWKLSLPSPTWQITHLLSVSWTSVNCLYSLILGLRLHSFSFREGVLLPQLDYKLWNQSTNTYWVFSVGIRVYLEILERWKWP